ncbi:7-keto-8-aminopelargonate synthetase-like enzyme [Rhizobium leguminosarum bv. trifolii WSM2297]|uniref:7-keto-8-aminopelargonate synthetase-like enzyme n=1 Tax=Rhizobium leguminosarum bv. trifolii WSM2297 TaxID=754762 RepID=J0W4Y7_RHILT|nr:aminotransferase class I/II-fold pyridoxal phosphate-dependent enzyme [Rhizobium leguminosarum]EJC80203.1 7-keto-8-aminopelargonate synthetase-like enzyme [Rhizobium leguminosarum bv. trifolii WSM2297]
MLEKLKVALGDHDLATMVAGDNRQIGLVRRDCQDLGISKVTAVADAYHEVKSQQSISGVWCYDNFTERGSNSAGVVKSDAYTVERDCIIWPVNHYLGLNRHPTVVDAASKALQQFGTGCGTSAMSGGHCSLHKQAEKRLASWLGKEAALLFPTGYSANVGAISGLAKGPSCFVLFDRECHASIIDGIKLSGAKFLPFRHNDISDLARKLDRYAGQYENVFVVVESIYSMSGEESRLQAICDLKSQHDFLLFVDEAHSFGLHPERTLCRKLGLTDHVDFVMTTLSKSTAAIGGVVATSHAFKTFVQVEANAYLFQAAIPPADVAAIIAAMDVIEETPHLLQSLWSKVSYMRGKLRDLGLDIGQGTSPIIPVFIRDSDTLLRMGQDMFHEGIFTTSVAYPVVKHSEVRFRFILNESHSYEQIDRTVGLLEKLGRRYGVIT